MTGILDQVGGFRSRDFKQHYRPATTAHFVALRLADHLNDLDAVRHYVDLCDRHSVEQLLAAYRVVVGKGTGQMGRRFQLALASIGTNAESASNRQVAAIRIERRAIAIAILSGDRLIYPPIARQLS